MLETEGIREVWVTDLEQGVRCGSSMSPTGAQPDQLSESAIQEILAKEEIEGYRTCNKLSSTRTLDGVDRRAQEKFAWRKAGGKESGDILGNRDLDKHNCFCCGGLGGEVWGEVTTPQGVLLP